MTIDIIAALESHYKPKPKTWKPKITERVVVAREIVWGIQTTPYGQYSKETYNTITKVLAKSIGWGCLPFRRFCAYPPEPNPPLSPIHVADHVNNMARLLPIRHLLEELTLGRD